MKNNRTSGKEFDDRVEKGKGGTVTFRLGNSLYRRLIKEYKASDKIIDKVDPAKELPISMTVPTFELRMPRGTNKAEIRFVENGFFRPDDAEKKKMAEALGRSVEEVFPRVDPIIPC